jgi:aminoglycoside 6'-N-acetyltransferase I
MSAETRYGIDIRGALPADAGDIAQLLRQLGYAVDPRQAAERLDLLARQSEGNVLVATDFDGSIIGLIALNWCVMLQQERPVARITTLVVDDRARRRGIGRQLIKAGAQAARVAGCDVLELTSAMHRAEAHEFYRSIGFADSALRFSRTLRKKPPTA